MMSRRTDYFAFGTAILVVAGVFAAIGQGLDQIAASTFQSYSLWTCWPFVVAYVLFAIAVGLFVLGFVGAPFPFWKTPKFPNIEIEINQVSFRGDPPGERPDHWIAFWLRITSFEDDQTASVSFRYRAKLDWQYEYGRLFGETVFSGDKTEPPNGVPTEWLADPLNVLPQHSYGGSIVVKLENVWATMRAIPIEESLLVQDHNSRQAVVIPAEIGTYDSASWKPATKDKKGYWTVYPADEDADAAEPSTEV
jgi:hypothetical protein